MERQKVQGWGKALVTQLAAGLQAEFPGKGGYSAYNPSRMKGFFETHSDAAKLAPLVREVGRNCNLLIMSRFKHLLGREFHLRIRLSEEQKYARIHNLLQDLRRSGLIQNRGSRSKPKWVTVEQKSHEDLR